MIFTLTSCHISCSYWSEIPLGNWTYAQKKKCLWLASIPYGRLFMTAALATTLDHGQTPVTDSQIKQITSRFPVNSTEALAAQHAALCLILRHEKDTRLKWEPWGKGAASADPLDQKQCQEWNDGSFCQARTSHDSVWWNKKNKTWTICHVQFNQAFKQTCKNPSSMCSCLFVSLLSHILSYLCKTSPFKSFTFYTLNMNLWILMIKPSNLCRNTVTVRPKISWLISVLTYDHMPHLCKQCESVQKFITLFSLLSSLLMIKSPSPFLLRHVLPLRLLSGREIVKTCKSAVCAKNSLMAHSHYCGTEPSLQNTALEKKGPCRTERLGQWALSTSLPQRRSPVMPWVLPAIPIPFPLVSLLALLIVTPRCRTRWSCLWLWLLNQNLHIVRTWHLFQVWRRFDLWWCWCQWPCFGFGLQRSGNLSSLSLLAILGHILILKDSLATGLCIHLALFKAKVMVLAKAFTNALDHILLIAVIAKALADLLTATATALVKHLLDATALTWMNWHASPNFVESSFAKAFVTKSCPLARSQPLIILRLDDRGVGNHCKTLLWPRHKKIRVYSRSGRGSWWNLSRHKGQYPLPSTVHVTERPVQSASIAPMLPTLNKEILCQKTMPNSLPQLSLTKSQNADGSQPSTNDITSMSITSWFS